MDKIIIRDLAVNTIIGLNASERVRKQKLVINLEINLDLSVAAASGNLMDSVNYAKIEDKVYRLVNQSRFLLLESLAAAVGNLVLEEEMVKSCKVIIDKPQAAKYARSIAMEITFARKN